MIPHSTTTLDRHVHTDHTTTSNKRINHLDRRNRCTIHPLDFCCTQNKFHPEVTNRT